MTAPSGRARRADAERNARLLKAAARALFDERGPDVALDEIARRAGVGNATLYRHYPTRSDLLMAVYADEVAALCDQGAALMCEPASGEAFFTWLETFAVHVATRRTLAFAGTQGDGERRTELFDRWHASLTSTAEKLLAKAQEAGAVRTDLTVAEVLALANAVAVSQTDANRVRRLLEILRHGLSGSTAPG
ncbi:TetR/AcrR family transcriptional regulator [Actinomadura rudentiformis]|uniref:Helix-turn-helix transcriptional regulator n=1 Tax=Actinomadura rudentiformis TaxID=359158 RepID=A0A6H9YZK1_9ACTN|nr:TetR/AcrR family transcriptional regulator [Actinomadura rudentiformis]KAB2349724.1 helix-turn-helix transcriptional regulator [Actinomadura rudentiformis]